MEDQGVDFWWIDWQQGSHGKMDPLWLLNHYRYSDNCRTGLAGLILSRYGGPATGIRSVFQGHHCDLGIPSLSTLFYQHSFKYRLYVSHDIGGHMRGYYDEDLGSSLVAIWGL